MDVGYQKGEEPDPAFPDRKGYTELKRVYDINGNDPSKPGQAAPQQNQPAQNGQGAPLTQQGNGSWGNQAPQQNAPQQQPQPQQQAPQQNAQPGQAWQPQQNGNGGNGAPPWGSR